MQESTVSPPPHRGDRERTRKLVTAVFAIGISLFGYGFAVSVGLLPAGWGIFGVFQYVLLTVGALLGSLMALVLAWSWRRVPSRPLTWRRATLTSLVATVLALLAVVASHWLRVGDFSLPQFLNWTALGLLVLSLQFPLGTIQQKRRRRLVLIGESSLVFAVVFGVLTVDRGAVNLVSYLFVSGGATASFLLFGSPLYLLGSRLNRSLN